MAQSGRRVFLFMLAATTVWVAFPGNAISDGPAPDLPYQSAKVTFADWPQIPGADIMSRFFGFQAAVDRDTTDGELAYDYSPFLMKDQEAGIYRLYTGGRWLRRGIPHADGDHVLHFVSQTGGPGTWFMPRHRPEFWLPAELGRPNVWYAHNCLEPEVVKVDGTYYMYAQVQGNRSPDVDLSDATEVAGVDRIVLFTSDDGFSWQRNSTSRGVVVNMEDPAHTALHHEEVIHVPWDADGRPFWMYVAANVAGQAQGYFRVRSDDPTTYDWSQRERAGLAQLGNQIAYAKQAPGGPLFVRITFTGDGTKRTVPTLQFSRDGLAWTFGEDGPALLDGSKDDGDNKNCYFLALSTLDGTGELERLEDGSYRALYAATTSATPVAPQIFRSEIGLGELILTLGPGTDAE